MTTLRTFKRRRQTMAAFLRTLKRSQFDLWVVFEKTTRCGTKACVMGWMPTAFPTLGSYRIRNEHTSWPHLRGKSLDPHLAAKFFALPTLELFYPGFGAETESETPESTAAKLLAAPYKVGKKTT